MPRRQLAFISGVYYHIYNRGVEKRPVFIDKKSRDRFLETLQFYLYVKQQLSLSNFFRQSHETRTSILTAQSRLPTHAKICCYVLMHNHFHLLVQQSATGNISTYLKNISDSYTRYFNSRCKRVGSLFQGQFKAVRVESDEQFIHVSRYIHLNPYTAGNVKTLEDLKQYPWSSLPAYLGSKNNDLVDKTPIQNFFKTSELYWKFIVDNAEYQRKLDNIKHLLMENPDVRG